ncbi:MAG: hypothetical protein V4532_06995, partial [Pseudomonadota bacterium]
GRIHIHEHGLLCVLLAKEGVGRPTLPRSITLRSLGFGLTLRRFGCCFRLNRDQRFGGCLFWLGGLLHSGCLLGNLGLLRGWRSAQLDGFDSYDEFFPAQLDAIGRANLALAPGDAGAGNDDVTQSGAVFLFFADFNFHPVVLEFDVCLDFFDSQLHGDLYFHFLARIGGPRLTRKTDDLHRVNEKDAAAKERAPTMRCGAL